MKIRIVLFSFYLFHHVTQRWDAIFSFSRAPQTYLYNFTKTKHIRGEFPKMDHSRYEICFQFLINMQKTSRLRRTAPEILSFCSQPYAPPIGNNSAMQSLGKVDSRRLMPSPPVYDSRLVLPVAFLTPRGGQFKDNQNNGSERRFGKL